MKAAFLISNGFEDAELVATRDILKRSNFDCDIYSFDGVKTTGGKGIEISSIDNFENLSSSNYDILIIPGGPGMNRMMEFDKLKYIVMDFYNNEKTWIAAICAAPKIFASLGIIDNIEIKCFPTEEEFCKKNGAKINDDNVMTVANLDKKIITSKNMITSFDFGFKIIECLDSKDSRKKLEKRF